MKKLLATIFFSVEIFADDVAKESFCTRLHQDLMDRWNALSEMHKMILGALAVVTAIWVLCRLMSCRGNKCCGCADVCTCSK